jgi:hypothetical protein
VAAQFTVPVAVVVATVAASSLFQPARKVLRRFVNRRIYGIEVDFDEIKRRAAKRDQLAQLPSHAVTSVGGYKNLELIARGGMGAVYKALAKKPEGRFASVGEFVAESGRV